MQKSDEEILKMIGEKLRRLRLEKGFTSYETFAFEYDVPRMQYWRMEKGKTNITVKSLKRVLDIHNMSFSEFFDFD